MSPTSVPAPPSPLRAVAVFLVAGLVTLSAVGAVLGIVQHRQARAEAIDDATRLTQVQAGWITKAIDRISRRGGDVQEGLEDVITDEVLSEQIVRVKIWDEDGRIVYSDDPALIGRRFDLSADELELFHGGTEAVAEVSNLTEEENRAQRELGERLMQVYVGMHPTDSPPLLFEAYHEYDAISAASRQRTLSFLPVLVGGLALLWLVQAPLAWRTATWLRASNDEREQLLVAALAASDRERQRLAADLHDGVVQGLSGASYTLTAEAARASASGQREAGEVLHGLAVDLRRAVRELRSLIVTITPPGMRRQPLLASVKDLVAPLEDRGVHVTLDVGDDEDVDHAALDLVLRTTQEAVRNILRHARPQSVTVRLRFEEDELVLTVLDDGEGFAAGPRRGRPDSMGLDLLAGLAQTEGGHFEVRSEPGVGTEVELVVPRHVSAPVPV